MTQSAKLISNATATGASQFAWKTENNNRAHDQKFPLNARQTRLCIAAWAMPRQAGTILSRLMPAIPKRFPSGD